MGKITIRRVMKSIYDKKMNSSPGSLPLVLGKNRPPGGGQR
jgi:hypothetical protein